MSVREKSYDLGDIKDSNIKKNAESPSYRSQIYPEYPNHLLEYEAMNDNFNNESESSKENDLPMVEGNIYFKERTSLIKGISLAFIFFSVIIYSLLYMLAPEKEANLIFEGSNLILNEEEDIFYKLDTVFIKEKTTIFNISLNVLSDEIDEKANIISIAINYPEDNVINNVTIMNYYFCKKLNGNASEYKYYKINDFPFWLYLYNSMNDEKAFNITSDYLINLLQI